MLAWVFGVKLGLSGGGPLSPTHVNLLKKFGACKTSWEYNEKAIFELISTVWIQIWPQFVQENSRSWVINLVCLLVRNCTVLRWRGCTWNLNEGAVMWWYLPGTYQKNEHRGTLRHMQRDWSLTQTPISHPTAYRLPLGCIHLWVICMRRVVYQGAALPRDWNQRGHMMNDPLPKVVFGAGLSRDLGCHGWGDDLWGRLVRWYPGRRNEREILHRGDGRESWYVHNERFGVRARMRVPGKHQYLLAVCRSHRSPLGNISWNPIFQPCLKTRAYSQVCPT